ncbi:MAG: hypothetical protein JWQ20_4656 [Conexibacter sp.]|nr:hypothetical protein [Conexibacter sp.]
MQPIIFSHGFGVRADSKGLFTDLRAGLAPEYDGRLLDLNIVDDEANTITVPVLPEQAKTLQSAIEGAGTEVDVIAHSQGCLVASLLPAGLKIRRIVLLAPPVKLESKLMETTYTDHPQTQTTPDGHLQIVRKNGDRIWMPPEYIAGIPEIDPVEWINRLATRYPVTLIRALDDELLDTLDDSGLRNVTVIRQRGDHDFDPPDRKDLIQTLKEVLKRT